MKHLPLLLLGLSAAIASSALADVPGCQLTCAAVAGGGTSAGGRFSVTATVGQAEGAQPLKGGRFNLEPGFWSGITVQQTEGAPVLKIRIAGRYAVLSWAVDASGFVLEQTSTVAAGGWTPVPGEVVDTPSEHTVTIQPTGQIMCYRLRKL